MKPLYLLFFALWANSIFCQVAVDINSGNPAFPFPQFLAYQYDRGHILENLAQQNPDGLVHAEMEKRIREAWLIMSNRFAYDGDSHAGVQYIQSNIGCPYDCSEGAGYGMIAAAYMADKTTFDGIWFREHDIRLVKHPRYRDGVVPRPGYLYGENALAEPGGDSATDGDVDIALGLLMAWRQWGDDSGYLDSNGSMISYKQEALNVIRGLVEIQNQGFGDCRSVSGVVGLDGYFKNGNTWTEITNWASGQDPCPEFGGPQQLHVDYVAPAYCKAFADFLETEGDASDTAWNIPQLRRAEASSDWFMGELHKQGSNTIPVAGWVALDNANNATFTNFNEGEDFRYAWRTILNHTWHGNPEVSWNPTTHQVVPGGNSFNKDMGDRFSKFLADPTIAGNACVKPGSIPLTFQGPSQVVQQYNPITAQPLGAFPINWLVGTGTPASVSAQDFDLMGKLYRQSAIEWDQATGQNLDSNPRYFHGFFRLLGMLVTTGNFQSPMNIQPEANIKVYNSVDKTVAFTGDEVTFTISYRNYGSVTAQNVVITDIIPAELEFVSATNGGVNTGGTVTWNIGTVPGFTTAGGITPTTGEVKVTCKVRPAVSGRICNPATITTTSGKGWTSNDFPNVISPVMQRNCVDIIEKALEIKKTVDFDEVNPGDVVTYSIDFKNSSKGGYINGGRSGINFAYARSNDNATGTTQGIKVRLYHGAAEPYINYENYRISLFLNDNTYTCLSGDPGCAVGWGLRNNIYEGGTAGGVQVSHESIVPGSDMDGAWNQRVIIQFSDQLCGPTPHLLRYFGLPRIHEGGGQPLRGVWDLFTSNFGNTDWSDDWSWDANASDADDGLYYPITDDWTDPENPVIVNRYHNEACETPTKTVNNILIEEFDGYVWRRVFGNGPVPGRDVENVVITDVLPLGFTFIEFVGDPPLGITPTTTVLPSGRTEIRWEIPRLQIGQEGIISYRARADFSSGVCERPDEIQTNLASIEALNESPITSSVDVNVTCNPVILPPPPSSMTKIATPASGDVGDQIVYTLSYENTDGSPIEVPLTSSSDWTTQSGPAMNIGGGALSSISNSQGVSTYNYSHGTNGTLEATIDFTPSAAFGFTMRHTGGGIGNGLYIVFKPNPGGGTVDTRVFDGTMLIDQTILGFPGNPMDIKLLLNGDQLNVWLGNTTNPTPTWSVTGIPKRAGNFGFINAFPDGADAFGTHSVSRFKTSMDSAFNLQITDPIPTEVSFVSASDSGVNTAGIVTYPLIPGPVLAGETITYTWTATIASCPSDTSTIVNIGYTNILGIPTNSIAAQALVNCSGVDLCSTAITEPLVMNATFCLNDPSTDLDTFITATETIIWYADDIATSTPITKPIVDTSVASNTTYYVSQKDINDCESGRAPIIVEVVEVPIPVTTNAIFCLNDTAQDLDTFITATETIIWYADDSATSVPITKPIVDTSIPSNTTYYVSQQNTGDCESIRIPISVEVVSGIDPPVITNAIFCLNDTTEDLDTFITATETIVWYADDIATSAPITKPIVDTSIASNTTYYVSQQNTSGCESTRVPITVQIIEISSPLITNAIFCLNDTAQDLDTFITATETIVWYGDDSATSAPITKPIVDTSIASNTTYYVAQQNDNCESERVPIIVQVLSPDVPVINTIAILSNESVQYDIVSEFGLIAGDFTWAAINNAMVDGETTTDSSDTIITDILINNTSTPQVVSYVITSNTAGPCGNKQFELLVTVNPLPTTIVSLTTTSVVEGDAIEVTITLSDPLTNDIELIIGFTGITADASDLDTSDQSITILAGETTASFARNTFEDAIPESNETVEISVVNVISSTNVDTTDTAVATIFDDDGSPSIVIGDATIEEGGILEVLVSLTSPAIDDITLTIAYTDIETTTDDYDTSVQTLTFPTNSINAVLSIQTFEDNLPENNESFLISVLSVDNGSVNDFSDDGLAIITDNNTQTVPDVFVEDYSVIEGGNLEFLITLSEISEEDITMTLSYINETTITLDYTITLQEITIPAGELNTTVTVFTIDDDLTETNESFILEIDEIIAGTVNNHSDTGRGIIIDNDNETVLFPSFFTPNGDNTNDNWHADIDFRNQVIFIWIFDRSGKLLKQLTPNSLGWNGEFNGRTLPSSEYWFKAQLQDGTYKQGHFSLIR